MIFKKQIFITVALTALCAPALFAMQDPNDLSMQLAKAAYEGNLEEVKNLLAEGANPNTPTRMCRHPDNYDDLNRNELYALGIQGRQLCPLVWAIDANHEPICKYLLDHGADANNANALQGTPLCWAAQAKNDNPALCLLLLRYGAHIDMGSPLAWAARKGNKKISEFLIKNGATDEPGALATAAHEGEHEMCEFYINRGVNVNTRLTSTKHVTPFFAAIDYATQFGWFDSVAPEVIKLLKIFIDAGANVNDQNIGGSTPLMFAANSWFLPEELLLEAGADPRIKNDAGNTALMICARRKSDRLVIDQRDLWPLIANSIFNPVRTDAQIQESRDRILTALMVFKQMCPKMPRDLRKYLLESIEDTKQDTLHSGAFGIREHLAALVPLQTVRSLINSRKWNKAKAVAVIKAHHYACIKPLMAEALLEAQAANNTPEMQGLLNPETAEQMYDGHIERNIKRRLGARSMLEWANDAVRTPTAYAPGSCVVQ